MKPFAQDAWEAWSPDELFARLHRTSLDWAIAGGWALDLWHGRQTRAHEDLEFSVMLDQIESARKALSDLEFFTAKAGMLAHLPLTEALPDDVWQLWGADMGAGRWRVDMMVERGTPDRWAYKRDPSLTLPRSEAIRRSTSGVPYLAPSIVLLFKAKHVREKDRHDFEVALPRLEPVERADLRGWLEVLHPGHEWIGMLRRE
jgi:hypothetical protein